MTPPLRLGFVGTGYIAGVVAAALRETESVVVAGVASRNMSRAVAFAEANALGAQARPFDDWRALVAWEGIDALYIATPTTARTEIAVAAANAGKHVLAEKPFTSAAALAAIETRNAERLELGRSLIETRLIEMSAEERRAFADRLERGLHRGKKD